MSDRPSTLLEFPCRFPIKAMGRQSAEFEALVIGLVCAHARLYPGEAPQVRSSKDGNYVSITTVIEAESQQQLDSIYQALTDCEQVLVAL